MTTSCHAQQVASLLWASLLPSTSPFHVASNAQRASARWLMAAQRPDDARPEAAATRGSFLAGAAASAAGILAVAAGCPEPANAIGELFEFKNYPRFCQHLVVNVPDMEAAVRFYVEGLGMQVLRSRSDGGSSTAFVGFGPESLRTPAGFVPGVSSFSSYGGHFSLELVAEDRPAAAAAAAGATTAAGAAGDAVFLDPGNGLQFVQVAVEQYRISKILETGGKILSGYGFVEVEAPGGLRLNVLSGDRRDPFMFTALKVKDLQRSVKWYVEVAGMRPTPYPQARPTPGTVFEPQQPKGSVFMAYEPEGAGVLLVPAARGETVRIGAVYSKLALLAENVIDGDLPDKFGASLKFAGAVPGVGTRVAVGADPDGYGIVFVEYGDWEKEFA